MVFMRHSRSLTMAFAGTLALGIVACGGKDSSATTTTTTTTQVTVKGKVTYTRIPVLTNDQGVATGFETDAAKFTSLPARGLRVRLFVNKEVTDGAGAKTRQWTETLITTTGDTGEYTFKFDKGSEAFIEVQSAASSTELGDLRIIADPNGTASPVLAGDRVLYSLRKAISATQPAQPTPLPGAVVDVDTTLDFAVDLNTRWWVSPPKERQVALATLETGEPSGSRPLAIVDTFMDFAKAYGVPTPGGYLDLHYRRGAAEARGTWIEMDRKAFPLSYHPADGQHFFGAVSGTTLNDDAFDRGALTALAARISVFRATGLQPIARPLVQLKDLSPESALRHGQAEALAALVLKTPYLVDLGVGTTDIRALGSAPKNLFSPAATRALTWEVALKANSLPTPGTPTDWAKLNPLAARRFFNLVSPKDASSVVNDTPSLYAQLLDLQGARLDSDPVALAGIFTDAALTELLKGYDIPWPRPTTGPLSSFMAAWGLDPFKDAKTLAVPLTLSMVGEELDASGLFRNQLFTSSTFGRLSLTKDQALQVHLTSPVPAGAKVEVRFSYYPSSSDVSPLTLLRTFDETTSLDPSAPVKRIVLPGLTGSESTGKDIWVSVRLVSPTRNIGTYSTTLQLIPTF